jgi:hypothetical protein
VQCIEALRAFAAAHEGKLPSSLEEMVDTPAPTDPATGKAFEYSVSGTVATLRPLPLTGGDAASDQTMQISVR